VSAREEPAEVVADILDRAATRGRDESVPYAGLVTPAEAWALQQAGAATIVDVRTRPEWEYVGRVRDSVLVEWRRYGESTPNPSFLAELAGHFDRGETLLFLCRSAVRSHHAAATAAAAGFRHAFNVLEGFEGDADGERRRGTLGGWRKAGLPWIQD
jgi:rhodanese-related sulfurtransferase